MTRARSVAILAGGRAERLGGRTKGLLEVDGQPIIDRQLAILRPLFEQIFLVTNERAAWSSVPSVVSAAVVLLTDRHPGSGPLGGIDAALAALPPAETSVVCVGGDMPFLDASVLALLRDHPSARSALVPRVAGHAEPLCARYSRDCLPAIAAALSSRRFKTAALLDDVAADYLDEAALRTLDPDLRTFTNVNTPEELAAAEAIAVSFSRR